MSSGAHVGSIEAVRDFRAALHTFIHEAREAISSHDFEVQRTLEWLLEAEPDRWQQIVRKCEETVTQAKIELERCRNSPLPGGGVPSCMEEKKVLERARQRLRYAEDKVRAVRKWGHLFEREAVECRGRANQLGLFFDAGLPKAIAALDHVLDILESYKAVKYQGGDDVATAAAAADPQSPIAAVRSPDDPRPAEPTAVSEELHEIRPPTAASPSEPAEAAALKPADRDTVARRTTP